MRNRENHTTTSAFSVCFIFESIRHGVYFYSIRTPRLLSRANEKSFSTFFLFNTLEVQHKVWRYSAYPENDDWGLPATRWRNDFAQLEISYRGTVAAANRTLGAAVGSGSPALECGTRKGPQHNTLHTRNTRERFFSGINGPGLNSWEDQKSGLCGTSRPSN